MTTPGNEPEKPSTSGGPDDTGIASFGPLAGLAAPRPVEHDVEVTDTDRTYTDRTYTDRTYTEKPDERTDTEKLDADRAATTVPLPAVPGGAPDATGTAAAPQVPETRDPDAVPGRRPPTRIRTVVFGLVLLAIAGVSLVAALTEVRVDGGGVLLVLLVGAGLALLGGGIASAAKEARGGPGV